MADMLSVKLEGQAVLEDDWKVENGVFESPLVKERFAQTLLFGLRNGSISADVTIDVPGVVTVATSSDARPSERTSAATPARRRRKGQSRTKSAPTRSGS